MTPGNHHDWRSIFKTASQDSVTLFFLQIGRIKQGKLKLEAWLPRIGSNKGSMVDQDHWRGTVEYIFPSSLIFNLHFINS